jgi:amino acid transporter, AAT family
MVSVGVIAINASQVKNFGEFEYWFSLVKVTAIVVFIVIGIALITGVSPRPALGLRNLVAYGGFLPHRLRGGYGWHLLLSSPVIWESRWWQ